jgi:short-subunit dehydrogenase
MRSNPRVVLITGASSGFGLATATLLQEGGCSVFGTSRNPSKTTIPSKFEMLALDVNSDDSVDACVKSLLEKSGGKIDVLVNNAGFVLRGGIEETKLEEARLQLETDFWGCVRMVKAVLPAMRKQGSGKIINIGSLGGVISQPFMGYYSISKFALEGFSEVLRQEVKSLGVWVSIVEPGFFKTNISNAANYTTSKIQDYDGMRERVYAALKRHDDAGQNPILVAKLIMKIIGTEKPKLHYPVGGAGRYSAGSMLFLKKIVPQSTVESQVRKMCDVDG